MCNSVVQLSVIINLKRQKQKKKTKNMTFDIFNGNQQCLFIQVGYI